MTGGPLIRASVCATQRWHLISTFSGPLTAYHSTLTTRRTPL